MSSENKIKDAVNSFSPISLDEMDAVKLMRRTDTKFVFNINLLPDLLQFASSGYYMLEIKNIHEQIYETIYFDTEDFSMYTLHHNGKLNRYKIRIRKYICSDQEFLEVKRKNNHGETIKNRIELISSDEMHNLDRSNEFLERFTPYNLKMLHPKLGNNFTRLTLVSKNFNERITLDYNLMFKDITHHKSISAKEICVAEIKKNKDHKHSPILHKLRQMRINPSGFSKYCIGLAMLNPEVKTNLFKQKIRELANI